MMVSGALSLPAQQTYDPSYFDQLFAVEDRHFWFRARNRVIETVVKGIVAQLAPGYRVLEPGCGTGNVLRVLARACPKGAVIGLDLFAEGLRHARQRVGCPLVQADLCNPCFTEAFQVIGLFDVLEHLPDDRGILASLRDMLAPKGSLIVTVPAHQTLWSYFDEASHHARRYEQIELVEKLRGAGLQVEFVSQYMAALLPLLWLGRRAAGRGRRRGQFRADDIHALAKRELRIVPGVNALLGTLLAWESRWLAGRRSLPCGTSLIAVARKA
jgi:SAM-dependent methyltransferase